MIEPEVSRRCPDCGAYIRERAIFCPQCGRSLDRGVVETTTLDDTVIEKANPVDEKGETANEIREPLGSPDQHVNDRRKERPAIRPLVVQNGNSIVREKGHRATAAAREVLEDNLLPRVERLRKVSSVVIDQAAYDPSLRFVLVAILLFAIFLVILILNELVG